MESLRFVSCSSYSMCSLSLLALLLALGCTATVERISLCNPLNSEKLLPLSTTILTTYSIRVLHEKAVLVARFCPTAANEKYAVFSFLPLDI